MVDLEHQGEFQDDSLVPLANSSGASLNIPPYPPQLDSGSRSQILIEPSQTRGI